LTLLDFLVVYKGHFLLKNDRNNIKKILDQISRHKNPNQVVKHIYRGSSILRNLILVTYIPNFGKIGRKTNRKKTLEKYAHGQTGPDGHFIKTTLNIVTATFFFQNFELYFSYDSKTISMYFNINIEVSS